VWRLANKLEAFAIIAGCDAFGDQRVPSFENLCDIQDGHLRQPATLPKEGNLVSNDTILIE